MLFFFFFSDPVGTKKAYLQLTMSQYLFNLSTFDLYLTTNEEARMPLGECSFSNLKAELL